MKNNKSVILVVDNILNDLTFIGSILKNKYEVILTTSGDKALNIVRATPPDLILLGVVIPEFNGFEVCRRLKDEPELTDIPVIFLTDRRSPAEEEIGFKLGAADYIHKPVSPHTLLARVRNQLALKQAQTVLNSHSNWLQAEINRHYKEMSLLKEASLATITSLAETRDNETGAHIKRTAEYMKELAGYLKNHPRFQATLTTANIQFLAKSASLHDIGKIGIPDTILFKPSSLTFDEFEIMKTHTTIGKTAISSAESLMEVPDNFLHFAKEIASYHHEKWNGNGYPEGLEGEAIPVAARLMAVADVYDALVNKRVYKPALPHAKAVSIIAAEAGSHFDPVVVDAFLALADQFEKISQEIKDPPTPY